MIGSSRTTATPTTTPSSRDSHVLIILPDDDANDNAPAADNANGSGKNAAPSVVVHVMASAPTAVGGGSVTVDVDASCTVVRLKEILQERTDGALLAAKVSLSFEKVEMKDGKALAEYFNPPPAEETTMEVCVAVRQPLPSAACNDAAGAPKMKQQQSQPYLQPQPAQQRMSMGDGGMCGGLTGD